MIAKSVVSYTAKKKPADWATRKAAVRASWSEGELERRKEESLRLQAQLLAGVSANEKAYEDDCRTLQLTQAFVLEPNLGS